MMIGKLFFICLILVSQVGAEIPLNPQGELRGYHFGFSILPDNTLPVGVPSYILTDTIRVSLSFIPPTKRVPIEEQPDPDSYISGSPGYVTFVYNRNIDYQQGRAFLEINPSFLSVGEWQVQIKAEDLNDLTSKYSDAKGFILETPPPDVPIVIEFMFVK